MINLQMKGGSIMANYMTKEAIMERMRDHYYEAKPMGDLFGVFLQGSQNYIEDKFFEGSDVDTRAIFVPSPREIILTTEGPKTIHLMDNEEHLDILDIRNAFKLYKKAGINNFETSIYRILHC